MTKTSKELLEGAYDLQSPQDNIGYYKDFAKNYDDVFADGMGYNSPAATAAVFKTTALPEDLPIADIGCGTGLTAKALDLPKAPIDGFDISKEMLEVAQSKNIYRALYCTDLTESVDEFKGTYGALISSGTFTLGHLGPSDLVDILPVLKPNGLACITVSVAHYKERDFHTTLQNLLTNGMISKPEIHTVPIYTDKDHDHAKDMTYVLSFRWL